MITPKQAKELCIEAHKGQWRSPRDFTHEEDQEFLLLLEQEVCIEDYILPSGNKIISKPEWLVQEPYSSHPIAVADMMSTEEEKIIAYLHDVIEDTSAQLAIKTEDGVKEYWLVYEGEAHILTKYVWRSLKYLTKTPTSDYITYIKLLSVKGLAKFKIADICHNLSDNPSETQKAKYLKALPILLATI